MPHLHVRSATGADLPSIAAFIVALNAIPQHRCLHRDEDIDAVRRSIEQLSPPPAAAFVIAEDTGKLVGVLGCDISTQQRRGWLWGPFADTEAWDAAVDGMFSQLLPRLPDAIRQLDNFLDLHNQRGIAALERHCFGIRGLSHVYEALPPAEPISVRQGDGLASAEDESFCAFHDALFPDTYKNGAAILAGRDADHRLFAVRDGALLGYLYASASETANSGYIHDVGVREDARGHGIGYHLLMSALHWMFDERGWTKASLTVADTHHHTPRPLRARGLSPARHRRRTALDARCQSGAITLMNRRSERACHVAALVGDQVCVDRRQTPLSDGIYVTHRSTGPRIPCSLEYGLQQVHA